MGNERIHSVARGSVRCFVVRVVVAVVTSSHPAPERRWTFTVCSRHGLIADPTNLCDTMACHHESVVVIPEQDAEQLREALGRLSASVSWAVAEPESKEARTELADAQNQARAALEEKGKLDG